MVEKREAFAPWSLTREAGVQSATVNGTIDVPQVVQPILSTGFVDYKGNWQGAKSNDEQFFGITTHLAVGNGGDTLSPATSDVDHIDMTGFTDIFIAIKPTRAGSVAIKAVMGPDTNRFANLSPVNSGENLRGSTTNNPNQVSNLFSDSDEVLTADVWNIIHIGQQELANQKNMQFKVTNNAGGDSDLQIGFLRTV
tara:strand:- start:287 stop:874 length:588 start_codon:yes stop_codon:yes gene_type:complete